MQFFTSLWQNWMSFFTMDTTHNVLAQQHPFAYNFLFWSFVLCFTYLLLVGAFVVFIMFSAAIETIACSRDSRAEDYDTLAASRFTTPVSVLVPAYNEQTGIIATVKSLLAMNYPQFQVIVVNDGSRDNTMDVLRAEFDLELHELFFRRAFDCKPVNGIYRSPRDARLIVVDKENGGKADALNCALNLAKYPYVCCVDGDSVYTADALLKGMRLAVRDPETVIGVSSTVGIALNPEDCIRSDGMRRIDRNLLSNFQHLDYLRSFINARLGWSRGNFMLCAVGAFAIWRRDVLEELGGFDHTFTCEDIEISFRAYEHFLRHNRPMRVLALPDTVAFTEGPEKIRQLVSQRERWQRVIMETVWAYRRMMLNPRYGSVGMIGMPYYFLSEFISPLFQALSVASLATAVWFGVISWPLFGAFALTVAFCNAIYTTAALWLQDASFRPYRTRDLLYLALIAPIELFTYRPILFYAQIKGAIGFLRGDKNWHKFERNNRGGGGSSIAEETTTQRANPEAIPQGARITSSQ